jgi:hypothetical protein
MGLRGGLIGIRGGVGPNLRLPILKRDDSWEN